MDGGRCKSGEPEDGEDEGGVGEVEGAMWMLVGEVGFGEIKA